MWKNQLHFNKLNRLYQKFLVKGFNQDRLINSLRAKGITLYNVKKKSNKEMAFMVKVSQSEKVFAITNKLCYNIKYNGKCGLNYPLYYLLNNVGLVIGLLAFAILTYLFSFVIVDFEFVGSGKAISEQLNSCLNEYGIKRYSLFKLIDSEKLENKLLIDNDNLTFVNIYQQGNKLVINSSLKQGTNYKSIKAVDKLFSSIDGIVKEIKVYKGTATVKVGDKVTDGQLLVDGYLVIRNEKISTQVVAKVLLEVIKKAEYISKTELLDDDVFLMVIENANLIESQIINKQIKKEKIDNSYKYTVVYSYNTVIQTE